MLKNQPFDVSYDVGIDSSISGEANRVKPKLAFCVGCGDMDVRGLISFIGVEVKSEAANPQDRRHRCAGCLSSTGLKYTAEGRFLDWFVEEQLEEVTTMNDLLAVIRRAGPAPRLFVEEYLSRRGRAALESPAAPSIEPE